jgi:hypothetical protein
MAIGVICKPCRDSFTYARSPHSWQHRTQRTGHFALVLSMPDLFAPPVFVVHRRVWLSAHAPLPIRFQSRIVAALADAKPSASGGSVKRGVLAIFPCMRTPAGTEKFLRSRFALLTFPPRMTRKRFASAAIMQPINERKNTMSSKPSHRGYVVSKPKEGNDQKGFWHEVGVVWPHKTGKGFDLVIHDGISVSGRIVCTEPKKDDDKP